VSFRDCQEVSDDVNGNIVCEDEEKEEESVKLDGGSQTTGSKEADTNEGSETSESKETEANEGSKRDEGKEVDTNDPGHSSVELSDSTIRPKKLRILGKRKTSDDESESGDERMDESEDMDEAERYKKLFSEKFRILTCDKNKTPDVAISEIYIEDIENFLK
jgi:hypothetical protein